MDLCDAKKTCNKATEKSGSNWAEEVYRKERLAGVAFFFGEEELGEARFFLRERKVFVVARVKAIFAAQLNGDFQVGHGGVGFAGQTIERRQGVMDMIRFGRGFARLD